MLKIDKRIVINVHRGTVTERMANYLIESEQVGMVSTVKRLQQWSLAGFLLEELGGGVLNAWVAMEQNGELANLTRSERSQKIVTLLGNITGAAPVATSQAKPEPEQKPEPKKVLKVPVSSLSNLSSDAV